jgi:nicotinate-nucleotide adenylyltransferase
VRRAPEARPLKSEIVYPGMRIGLLGGSFDPAHGGHLHVARTAMARLGLDRVWWIVSPQNPLKRGRDTGGYERRLAGVAALAREPGFVVSDIERRLGTPYTADVVAALVARHPRARFVFIMGADNLQSFHRWKNWTAIFASVPIAVVARSGASLKSRLSPAAQQFRDRRVDCAHAGALLEMSPPAWLYLTARLDPTSSTALRARGGARSS